MPKDASRRCAICQTNWPNLEEYHECPRGHGETFLAWDEKPLGPYDARKVRQSYEDFEKFYEAREDRRIREEAERVIAESLAVETT